MDMLPPGKRNVADVTQVRVWRWGDYPRSSRWAQCHHKRPYKSVAGGSEAEREVRGQKGRSEWCSHEARI